MEIVASAMGNPNAAALVIVAFFVAVAYGGGRLADWIDSRRQPRDGTSLGE